jgi:O-acetyl-ADP-ribose deacetylase (regulator of RNase III)
MKQVNGDILKQTHGIIVHGCNSQGKMGKGLALSIVKKYPIVYHDYKVYQSLHGLYLGDTIVSTITPELLIVSGIIQFFYGNDKTFVYAVYPAIEQVFSIVNKIADYTGLPVLFPSIGCGLANGDWSIVKEIIERNLNNSVEATHFNYSP